MCVRERERVCVCVCVRERERGCVCVPVRGCVVVCVRDASCDLKPGLCSGLTTRDSRRRARLGDVFYSGRSSTRAEDAQDTPTRSHISSSIPLYEDGEEGSVCVSVCV